MSGWARWGRWGLGGALALAVSAAAAGQLARRSLAASVEPEGARIDVGGRALRLSCSGQRTPAVLFEAGLGDFSVQWVEVRRLLPGQRTCAWDRAGLGFSDPGGAPTLEAAVGDLEGLVAAAGLEDPFVLVGHSFGAVLARAYQAKHPGRVAGLVLVDPAHEAMAGEAPVLEPALRAQAAQFRSLAWLARAGALAFAPEQIPARGMRGQALAEYRVALATGSFFSGARAESEAFLSNLRAARGALPSRVEGPLAVVSRGRADPVPGLGPEAAARWEESWRGLQGQSAALSSAARHTAAPNSGHDIPREQPEAVADAVRWVVDEVRAASASADLR